MANDSPMHTANGMDVIANLDGDVMQTIAVAVEQMRKDFMKVKKPGKIGLDGSALREQILDNARHLYRISYADAIPKMRLVVEKSEILPYQASVWYDRGGLMQAPGLLILCGYPGKDTVVEALEDLLERSIEQIAKKTAENSAKAFG